MCKMSASLKVRLTDIDTLTESINYVPVIAGATSNDFARKLASFNEASDGDNQDNDGPNTKSEIDNQERPNAEHSTKDINTVGPSINTASSNFNTGSPTVNTVRLSDDFFGADNDMRSLDGVELDISNISAAYPVPTTPNTRINKDPSLNNMDVKSAFLYGRITEEVYLCQPPRFEDPDYPDKVYKVEKALHGLHQAPRAWYKTLASYLLGNGFRRGKIDQPLFIKRQKDDILLVQVYVDDIIFGSTEKELYTEFEIASTPMDKEKALLKDSDGDDVDVYLYKSMIKPLIYLTSSRPDIMFVTRPTGRCRRLVKVVSPKIKVILDPITRRYKQSELKRSKNCLVHMFYQVVSEPVKKLYIRRITFTTYRICLFNKKRWPIHLQESNEEDEVESPPKKERNTIEPSVDKIEVEIPKQNDKAARRPVKYAEMYRTQRPKGNQRNWNNLKSHQLGSNFVMYNKACYACGSFNHLQARCKYHQRERMAHGYVGGRCRKRLGMERVYERVAWGRKVYNRFLAGIVVGC
nr:putative ribonuclease H-like domain-containing protein [Tanacetum cinerariifolium]